MKKPMTKGKTIALAINHVGADAKKAHVLLDVLKMCGYELVRKGETLHTQPAQSPPTVDDPCPHCTGRIAKAFFDKYKEATSSAAQDTGDARKALDALEFCPKLLELVSDEELDAAWFGNFGESSRREIIADTVLKIGGGWSTGSTAMTICHNLGLITKWRGVRQVNLTKKGKRYLYYCFKPTSAALAPLPEVEGLERALNTIQGWGNQDVDERWHEAQAIILTAARNYRQRMDDPEQHRTFEDRE